ncbi:T9SS type A sorting domain-containing protein [Hyunsoonleella pacifica]|uniref:T9SS type A sorting domain-containing protein n=1 Tax=Hyunsoonleella pacifica TaxID=1080224 RepID=A0A4Q9FUR3_9FLAO|nr:T9SS type A sorting domain-containing protein [Hyunsoonleella pacifica]TBN18999.1 T9SS type A sorting domain-containing protein [Hyunsoonleella pacifica]GGD06512.1 hypothetical protein GCM10011368_05460 [Hyunsoonleella pacifica]
MKKITLLFSLTLISYFGFAQTTLINWDGINPAFDFPFDSNTIMKSDTPDPNPDQTGNTTPNVRLLQVAASAGGFAGYGGEFTSTVDVSAGKFLLVYLRSDVNNYPVRFQFTDDPISNRTQNPLETDFTYTGNGDWQLLESQIVYASQDFGIPGQPNLNGALSDAEATTAGVASPYTPNLDGIVNRYSVFPDFNDSQSGAFSLWFDEVIVNNSATLSTDDLSKKLEGSVFPNPARLAINIRAKISDKEARIYDIHGKHIDTKAITGNFNSVDVSRLSSGMYFLVLESGSSFKFIKE